VRSRTPAGLPGRCQRCWLKEPLCVCARLPAVRLGFPLVIVRHVRESAKSTNTARIAALALPGTEVVEYEGPQTELSLGEGWLLFTGGEPLHAGAAPPPKLVVLDGTWRQARRMIARSPALARLRRVSLPAPAVPLLRGREAPRWWPSIASLVPPK